MDDSARARIRRLYFVDRVSLCDIAATLRLAAAAVRGALVLPGGQTPWRAPAPLATALAAAARTHAPQPDSRRSRRVRASQGCPEAPMNTLAECLVAPSRYRAATFPTPIAPTQEDPSC